MRFCEGMGRRGCYALGNGGCAGGSRGGGMAIDARAPEGIEPPSRNAA